MDIILNKYFNKTHLFVINEASSDKVSIARYILTPDIFDTLRSAPNDASGEVMLADAINIQAQVALDDWLRQYNQVRRHHTLNMRPPLPEN